MTRMPTRRLQLLPTLIVLFAVAGGLRMATGLDAARAQNTPGTAALTLPRSHPPTAELADNLIDLARREDALRQREAALSEREAVLGESENRLRRQIADLTQAEADLAATLTLAASAAETDISRLVSVFESMKPEDAAPVFAEMDPSFAAGFIGRLRPDVAAAILAGMEPRQAYLLSMIVAGRNANVPRN